MSQKQPRPIFKRSVHYEVGGKIVVFDMEKSQFYIFNPTASLIIEKLKLGWGENRILQELLKEYDIDKARAERDLKALLLHLNKIGLFE